MPPSTRRRNDPDDDEPDRRGRGGSPSPLAMLVPAGVLLGLIAAAILLARTISSKQVEQAAATAAAAEEKPKEPEKKYFTTVPDEKPPEPRGGSGHAPSNKPRAPEGLAESNPDWAKALELARVADELFAEASQAKAADDHETFQLKGKAAKESYDKAIEITAVWEEELLDKYGDRDPQVRAIQNTRTRWTDRLRVLHKTTSR